jgi:hypothetical protein
MHACIYAYMYVCMYAYIHRCIYIDIWMYVSAAAHAVHLSAPTSASPLPPSAMALTSPFATWAPPSAPADGGAGGAVRPPSPSPGADVGPSEAPSAAADIAGGSTCDVWKTHVERGDGGGGAAGAAAARQGRRRGEEMGSSRQRRLSVLRWTARRIGIRKSLKNAPAGRGQDKQTKNKRKKERTSKQTMDCGEHWRAARGLRVLVSTPEYS